MSQTPDPDVVLDIKSMFVVCIISPIMVGVCMLGIGLLRIAITISTTQTFADDFLCIDAVGFLIASFASYFAIRKRRVVRNHPLELIADLSFLGSMALLAAECFYITYMISVL
jgi:hypothetical protein